MDATEPLRMTLYGLQHLNDDDEGLHATHLLATYF